VRACTPIIVQMHGLHPSYASTPTGFGPLAQDLSHWSTWAYQHTSDDPQKGSQGHNVLCPVPSHKPKCCRKPCMKPSSQYQRQCMTKAGERTEMALASRDPLSFRLCVASIRSTLGVWDKVCGRAWFLTGVRAYLRVWWDACMCLVGERGGGEGGGGGLERPKI
jgi:hypothetical protein